MSFSALQTRRYPVEILTEHYFLAAVLEPAGQLMNYMNHPNRVTMLLKEVTASALDVGSNVGTFQADELWTRREEILAIRFLDKLSANTVQLLPKKEKLRVFLPRFIVQGVFRCGVDTHGGDIFEAMSSYWAPATDNLVYPLLPGQCPIFHEAVFLLINRRRIRFYQQVKE